MNKQTFVLYSEMLEKIIADPKCKIVQASIQPVGESGISIKSICKIEYTITDKEGEE